MSDVNEIPPTPESNGPVCSTASNVLSACLFRLAMYAPVALIMSGLAALAMYPELADYGYPLTGNPSHTGFTGERPCQSDRACAAGSLHSNYPLLPVEDSSCSSPSCTSQPNTTMNSGCCP
jgi:hypothetical protein